MKKAAQTTACPGDSTRVDTTVAIELAGVVEAVDVVEDQRGGDERDDDGEFHGRLRRASSTTPWMTSDDVLDRVDGRLEVVEDLLPLHDGDRVLLLVEEAG
ncbi:MAG: hypothetical protein MZV64_42225 [Ignavibacteriales bacterium]|nr:hypothetical protein [Ignavibacteriales bacterium]